MRIVFLDVDGVLNCLSTKETHGGFIGIDSKHVAHLAALMEKSERIEETKIVLSSSWRIGEDRNGVEMPDSYAYLTEKLAEYDLTIFDDTPRLMWGVHGRSRRGREIAGWFYNNRSLDITGFVVLDDETFQDFNKYQITPHLVRTSLAPGGGLNETHVKRALNTFKVPLGMYASPSD